jgi:7-cyano-7-deazaguanine synthase in queuosine biosynthesis
MSGELGPHGITETAADLIDFAMAVYQIEKQLRRFSPGNKPTEYDLKMKIRDPSAWNQKAIDTVEEILRFMGNAKWKIKLKPGLKIDENLVRKKGKSPGDKVKQVALFSGGLDSTCGLTTIAKEAATTRLVFFSTGRRTAQEKITKDLGFKTPPIIFSSKWNAEKKGRNRSFYYRSFLFLCLAAAVANSWQVKRILQFENGVLASSIPPSPAWVITKHAHPRLHQLASALFSVLLGGKWTIENPFALKTKRKCFEEAVKSVGGKKAKELAKQTITCWYHWANFGTGGKSKKPGEPCGVCIPCIVRRTALQDRNYMWDLKDDDEKNNPARGLSFRSYFGFLKQVADTEGSPEKFYLMLPAEGRRLISLKGPEHLNNLHKLFLQFSEEFMETFNIAKS